MDSAKPTLTRLADFQQILSNYHVSEHAKKVLDTSDFVVLCGVAGGGRNTLINYLVETGPYHFVVSDTTRPPKFRDGKMEVHGVNYFFRTEEEFLADLEAGEFIEAEIIHNQQVSGTSIRELQRAKDKGLIGIHDFDIVGTQNVHAASAETHIIALLPPDYEEWQRRLGSREEMHAVEFKNRMETALRVLTAFTSHDYYRFLVSDDVTHSSKELRDIVEHDIYTDTQHARGMKIAYELLQKTDALLKTL